MKRVITEDEEQCYRLRHHKFAGLTTKETAKQMKIPIRKVQRILRNLKVKAPQLFPIFTFQQHLIYWLYVEKGLTQSKIANYLGIAISGVGSTICTLRKKGISIVRCPGHRNDYLYEKKMDIHIIYKF